MKRFLWGVGLIMALLLLLLFLIPYSINIPQLRQGIRGQVERRTGMRLEMGPAGWSWFPYPALRIARPRLLGEGVVIEAASLELWPDLSNSFRQRALAMVMDLKGLSANVTLGKAGTPPPTIQGPQPAVNTPKPQKAPQPAPAADTPPELPFMGRLRISEGRILVFKAPRKGNRQKRLSEIHLSRLVLGTDPHRDKPLSLSIEGDSDLVTHFALQARLSPKGLRFQGQGRLKGVQTARLLAVLGIKGRAVSAPINFTFQARGQGLDRLDANVTGDAQCIVIGSARPHRSKAEPKPKPLSCSAFSFSLTRRGPAWGVELKGLNMANPHIESLKGMADMNDKSGRLNLWLKGRGIDVAQLRETLLRLLPPHKDLIKVTNIVKGGRLAEISVRFSGPKERISKIEAFQIEMKVKGGVIDVPKAHLHLTQVNGPATIVKGMLKGRHLSAVLGKSRASNGVLELGLHGHNPPFHLLMDVNATMADLRPILERMVHNSGFQKELKQVAQFSGWVEGRFEMGPRLHKSRIAVEVKQMKVRGLYRRLLHPIEIDGGRLRITNHALTMEGVKGRLGDSAIGPLSGRIRWGTNSTVVLSEIKGRISIPQLLQEVAHYPKGEELLHRIARSAKGEAVIVRGKVSGPFQRPDEWRYDLQIKPKAFTVETPLIPFPLMVTGGTVELSNDRVILKKIGPLGPNDAMKLSGSLSHTHWHQWKGTLTLSGVYGKEIIDWLQSKGWIPDRFLPAAPMHARNLRVKWGSGPVEIKGELSRSDPRGRKSTAWLDLSVSHNLIDLRRLSISHGRNRAVIRLLYRRHRPRHLEFNFSGVLPGEALDLLLNHNQLVTGKAHGEFSITLDATGAGSRAAGQLSIEDGVWHWGLPLPVKIKRMGFKVVDGALRIQDGVAQVGGEEFTLEGTARPLGYGLHLNVVIAAKTLSWHNLARLFGGQGDSTEESGPPKEKSPSPNPVSKAPMPPPFFTGAINLDAGRFLYLKPFKGDEKQDYLFQPLKAGILIGRDGAITVEIHQASLCGLSLNGCWKAKEEGGDFNIFTNTPLPFRETLSCLHEDTSVIDGTFTASVNLSGHPGHWKAGEFELRSTGGRILKMGLLAKVLAVVNIKDLFSQETMEGFFHQGFPYDELEAAGKVQNNRLEFTKGVVKASGLNLFWKGDVGLDDYHSDIILFVAPFKTVDSIVTKIPLLGRMVTGKNREALILLPVKIQGALKDPSVTVMPPGTVGKELVKWMGRVVTSPFSLLIDLGKGGKKEGGKEDGQ